MAEAADSNKDAFGEEVRWPNMSFLEKIKIKLKK